MILNNVLDNERTNPSFDTWHHYYTTHLPGILGEHIFNGMFVKCTGDILDGSVVVKTLGDTVKMHIEWTFD